MGGNTQKLDVVIDKKLPNDLDSASIFIKVIGHKLSDGSSYELYLRCRMNFAGDVAQTQISQFMDLGIPTINTLDESSVLGTLATRIWSPIDVSYWRAPDHIFGEAKEVGMSAAKSDHDYNYKTDFEIWRGNQEFERQNISMSWPPLDSTPIGTNMTNSKTSHLDLTHVGTKTPDPKPLTRPMEY